MWNQGPVTSAWRVTASNCSSSICSEVQRSKTSSGKILANVAMMLASSDVQVGWFLTLAESRTEHVWTLLVTFVFPWIATGQNLNLKYFLWSLQNVWKLWKIPTAISQESKLISSNCSFCPINSQKPKAISFIKIRKQKKQQILTSEGLGPMNIWYFCLINDLND